MMRACATIQYLEMLTLHSIVNTIVDWTVLSSGVWHCVVRWKWTFNRLHGVIS
jgi:hypothetical protein